MTFEHLSDEQLVASLQKLCVDARRLDAHAVAHLVEVEERRLHLKAACSSLFDFCVRRLGMSEGAAFRRINAARLARRFPCLVGHLERGTVHLSRLVMLRDHLTEVNVDELVAATAGQTKRQTEELLARIAPRPDVPSTLRKLPTRNVAHPSSPGGGSNSTPSPTHADAGTQVTVNGHADAGAEAAPRAEDLLAHGGSLARPHAVGRVEALSEARYKMQLTVSSEVREKVERARDLMRHRNPSGDLAVVLERALDALIERLEKERLAKTQRPRRERHPNDTRAEGTKGRISAATRREVFARDGEQCSYVDDQGRRCPSVTFLELDHIESRARGGSDHPSNLRVACRAHNRLHAEQVFGRKCVERGIHFRRQKSEPGLATPSGGGGGGGLGRGERSSGVSAG